jgi:tetratricopeptide (TPR) repeat protein
LLALCLVEQSDGRFEEAKALAEEALERARDRNDFGAMGWALQFLGSARSSTGDTGGAVAALEESLAFFRQSGAVWGETDTLTILAAMARAEGDVTRAAHFYADSIRLRRDADELVGVYNDLVGLATIAREQGHGDAATRLLGADDVHRTRSGYEGFSVTAQLRYQTRQALLEQLGEATFTREWETGRGFSTARAIAEALTLADELAAQAR